MEYKDLVFKKVTPIRPEYLDGSGYIKLDTVHSGLTSQGYC